MIPIPPAMKARLYLAMQDALQCTDQPESKEEAQRLALAQLVSNYTTDDGAFALHEAFRLASAIDEHLTLECGLGPHKFGVANVARLVGGDKDVAKAALRLLGARPTYTPDGPGDWATDPDAVCEFVAIPRDLLVNFIKLELEEAEGFAGVAPVKVTEITQSVTT